MGFIKGRSRNTYSDGVPTKESSSFKGISEQQLEEHLNVARYGSFLLTDAVRPSFDLTVVPSSGWRRDTYRDKETCIDVPVIMASQTREKLFDLFIDLLDPLGDEVDVVLETSHEARRGGHDDLYREQIDLPILKSLLYDFEDSILNDGCVGIAVLNPRVPMEVQFDEHKLLIMYGHDLEPFEEVLRQHGLWRSETLKFITEAEHIHSSTDEFGERFSDLRYQLGVEGD
ncbi:hypothetical protein [Planctomicrobium piriforme]|uniref:Uncharacterized protein n=1 Tax=Planctomicrobium piriforme TaxID=1576369 RepID=A0A1I3RSN4_9PLAN|nr:hypothetical protein [Planctomicrobium piriforme]SFJ48287.1 hypothetical protein SAMN05421753_12180 [Planctomicrobium piriforme]